SNYLSRFSVLRGLPGPSTSIVALNGGFGCLCNMAGSLPDELIVKIAEHLVEQVEPQQYIYFGSDFHGCDDGRRRFPNDGHTGISPPALALFSPVLLDEYIKILLDTKVFHFPTSASLYAFINTPGISEAALQRRRSIRLLRISKWGYDSSLGPAIRLMPRVTTVHINLYTRACNEHEAESRILSALQPIILRSQDLSTVAFLGYGKFGGQSLQVEKFEHEALSLFEWAKTCGLLDMVDMNELWAYTNGDPNPFDVLRQVWRENDNGRRTEPPDALLRRWNMVVATYAIRVLGITV
ncbi:uncharacterized protein BKA78DRAFT_372539, partial [Phyllosticta capitalensis]|uniref:uncharacterized protein n=1 Tax=Phyllosticta capitalensis TaxID=121624 RepID=UPI0031306BB7